MHSEFSKGPILDQPSKAQCDVLLLAAGFGKRLSPLTDNLPKPLVKVQGRTLLDWNLDLVEAAGLKKVFINVHYLPNQIRQHLAKFPRTNLEVEIVEEPVILDTGGAIKNIEHLLKQDLLLTLNSDNFIGRDFSLADVIENHRSASDGRIATLCLREDKKAEEYGSVGIDSYGRVCSFLGVKYCAQEIKKTLMYLGVQVLERKVHSYMPPRGSIFSVTRDTHVKILGAGEVIGSYIYSGAWSDVGTLDRLKEAQESTGEIYGVSQSAKTRL